TPRHRRCLVVAARTCPGGLARCVDHLDLRDADREEPHQSDGERDEHGDPQRQLGRRRAPLVAPHPMPSKDSTWSNKVRNSCSPKPPVSSLNSSPARPAPAAVRTAYSAVLMPRWSCWCMDLLLGTWPRVRPVRTLARFAGCPPGPAEGLWI